MSYTPTTWADGDLITAQKLNNIEQGITNNDQVIEQLQNMQLEHTSIVPNDMFDYITVDSEKQAIISIFSNDTNSCAYGLWFHENGIGKYVPVLATGNNLTITAQNGEYANLTITNKSTATATAYVDIIIFASNAS